MPKNPYEFDTDISSILSGVPQKKSKPKKRSLTHPQKIWAWEHKSHVCNICDKRVTKISDAEFDHTRAYSKSGATNLSNVKIVHRFCNRQKGNKTISETKKFLGIKYKKKKRTIKQKTTGVTGEKKRVNPLEVKRWDFV